MAAASVVEDSVLGQVELGVGSSTGPTGKAFKARACRGQGAESCESNSAVRPILHSAVQGRVRIAGFDRTKGGK